MNIEQCFANNLNICVSDPTQIWVNISYFQKKSMRWANKVMLWCPTVATNSAPANLDHWTNATETDSELNATYLTSFAIYACRDFFVDLHSYICLNYIHYTYIRYVNIVYWRF